MFYLCIFKSTQVFGTIIIVIWKNNTLLNLKEAFSLALSDFWDYKNKNENKNNSSCNKTTSLNLK